MWSIYLLAQAFLSHKPAHWLSTTQSWKGTTLQSLSAQLISSLVRVTSGKLPPPPYLLNSPCNLLQAPQEEKYLQTYSINKTTQPTEQQLATAFLMTACWLKPIISSSAYHIVQLTQLLLLSAALCLYSRASSLLPAPAQTKHTLIGKELFYCYKYQLNQIHSEETFPFIWGNELVQFCQEFGQRRCH